MIVLVFIVFQELRSCSSPSAKRPNFSEAEYNLIKNENDGIREHFLDYTVDYSVKLCGKLSKVSDRTVYRALKNRVWKIKE